MLSTTGLILAISFFAALVRSTFGFGESLIAVPLFLFFLPLEVAVPLSVLLSIVIALVIVIQDHTDIHYKSAKFLVIYAILGIPIGVLILLYCEEKFVKILLGILIIAYSLYALFSKKGVATEKGKDGLWLFICGFLSGVFGGAYGINGPPLVVYGNYKNWSAKHFRATLQAYFLPASLLAAFAYFIKGLLTADVLHYFLLSLITTIPAIFLGRVLNQKLGGNAFFKYVYLCLIAIAVVLVFNAIW